MLLPFICVGTELFLLSSVTHHQKSPNVGRGCYKPVPPAWWAFAEKNHININTFFYVIEDCYFKNSCNSSLQLWQC